MPDPSGLEPSLPGLNWEVLAARWRLRRLTERELEEFAVQALLRDYDGPALRELAWHQDSWDDIDALVPRALKEVGLEAPDTLEAAICASREVAQRIESGEEPLWSGAVDLLLIFQAFDIIERQLLFPHFDYWGLEYFLETAWSDDERDGVEPEMRAIVRQLLAPPKLPAVSDLSPALGGTRSAAEYEASADDQAPILSDGEESLDD